MGRLKKYFSEEPIGIEQAVINEKVKKLWVEKPSIAFISNKLKLSDSYISKLLTKLGLRKITLAESNPELVEEWDFQKNLPLTPNDVTAGSNKKVWWVCKNNHTWQTMVLRRTKGSRCPNCAGRLPTVLAESNPELVKEWDVQRNAPLTPNDVSTGSGKKVWWICKNNSGHAWQAQVRNRTRRGSGCPHCAGYLFTTLAESNPELVKEWDFKKNFPLTPNDVTAGSQKKVWWICKNNSEHTWIAAVTDRARSRGGRVSTRGCPSCAGYLFTTLAESNPELVEEWDFKKNAPLTPGDVPTGSGKKVWWICKNNSEHVWKADIVDRTRSKRGCPGCAGRLLTILAESNPELIEEWDFQKNAPLTPNDVSTGSCKKVWWICKNNSDHAWQAVIHKRTRSGQGCPKCRHATLAESNPELIEEWDFKKNAPLTLDDVPTGSHKKVWWICKNSSEHFWQATIGNRARGRGCPSCSGRRCFRKLRRRNPKEPISIEQAVLNEKVKKLWLEKPSIAFISNKLRLSWKYISKLIIELDLRKIEQEKLIEFLQQRGGCVTSRELSNWWGTGRGATALKIDKHIKAGIIERRASLALPYSHGRGGVGRGHYEYCLLSAPRKQEKLIEFLQQRGGCATSEELSKWWGVSCTATANRLRLYIKEKIIEKRRIPGSSTKRYSYEYCLLSAPDKQREKLMEFLQQRGGCATSKELSEWSGTAEKAILRRLNKHIEDGIIIRRIVDGRVGGNYEYCLLSVPNDREKLIELLQQHGGCASFEDLSKLWKGTNQRTIRKRLQTYIKEKIIERQSTGQRSFKYCLLSVPNDQEKLIEFLQQHGGCISFGDLSKLWKGVGQRTIRKKLRAYIKEKIIERRSAGQRSFGPPPSPKYCLSDPA